MIELTTEQIEMVSGGDEMTYNWGVAVGNAVSYATALIAYPYYVLAF